MYKVWLFGDKQNTLKAFKTLKQVHTHLVDKYESKTTYGQLLKAMRENYDGCALYQDFNVVCIEKVY